MGSWRSGPIYEVSGLVLRVDKWVGLIQRKREGVRGGRDGRGNASQRAGRFDAFWSWIEMVQVSSRSLKQLEGVDRWHLSTVWRLILRFCRWVRFPSSSPFSLSSFTP